ncbi:pyocin knob domain-containing protein [Phocaeicola vulgatus]|uniref:pyocin knob domain-containing protein n=1 Tax=Phocaeicola vulgatus TaxID=821 RepID=UPI0034A0FA06
MSDLNLDNIVGFKAVDKDGNEQNVTVDEMVDMVSTRMVMALSETSTFAAVAATGNDVYENELPTVTDAANVRVLQNSGDAAQMTMQSLASKLGGLIGVNESWFRSRIPIFRGDVETLVVSGIYGVTPESTNNPINGYGILSVFSVGNESRVMYLLISVNGATFIRVKYDKSDSGWKKLSLAT